MGPKSKWHLTEAPLKVGDETWHRGEVATVTSEPYELYGGEFVDATTEDGRTVTLATTAQRKATIDRNLRLWKEQQAGFARLNGYCPLCRCAIGTNHGKDGNPYDYCTECDWDQRND